MKITEFRKLIREEVRRVVKEASDSEVVLSNEILNFLEERGVINANNAQRIHKDLTAFLKSKIIKGGLSEEGDIKDPAVVAAEKAAAAADIKAKELALNNAKKKLSNTR